MITAQLILLQTSDDPITEFLFHLIPIIIKKLKSRSVAKEIFCSVWKVLSCTYLQYAPLYPHRSVPDWVLESLEKQIQSDKLFFMAIILIRSHKFTK